jgi:hypothetical protein
MNELRGLKETRLRKKCGICKKGVFNNGALQVLELDITVQLVEPHAIKRQVGLEMMMGDAAPLAQVMGLNEDMTSPAYKQSFLVCQDCACKPQTLMHVLEVLNDREEDDDETD